MKSDDAKETLPAELEEVFKTQQVWTSSGEKIPLDSNVSESEARLLYDAVRELRPSRSVEVGLAKGVSTLAILGALAKNGLGNHVVMDPYQDNYQNSGIEMVRRAGLESWWQFHRKFAEEVIPTLGSIQFAFIDASHLFDLTLMEFVLVDKKLEVGGVVGFHDLWMPSLQSLYRYITRNRNYEVWRPDGASSPGARGRDGWRGVLRGTLRRLPKAERLFTREILHPWGDEGLGNLVLLRKREHDSRHWTFHQSF
jgi:predicted O-methyltransferase YrrM